ncbi:uncharacterized protein LOC126056150 [Helicoverpa armigera]|uniref:uncharacterized protein LOC126056150 n=1 Tax=Helicoverpa armigera TaxID=29058 RepID=UPI003082CA31
MAASEEDYKYLKRTGTAGVRGHLYETKLLSLIYFRLLHDDDFEEFYLGTNVDKLGSFDDICFRAKIKGCAQPLAVFIQAKHRENNSVLTLNSGAEMEKHLQSFLEIRKKLQPGSKDKLFEATTDKTQCLCVIYTTANGDKSSTVYEGANAEKLNDLIATAAGATKPAHHRRDIDRLCTTYLEYQMRAFARKMAKCIHSEMKDYQELSTDDHVLQYHVIIAKNFFNISDEQINGFRTANFKEDFLDEEGERFLLTHFQEELFTEIIKRQKSAATCAGLDDCTFVVDDKDKVKDEDIAAMYHHIASSIIYKTKRFKFIHATSSEKHNLILNKINSTLHNRNIALKTALLKYLPPNEFQFKVPAWFGNKDLTLRGDDKKQEKKLNDLTSKIVGLLRKSCGDRDPVATLADILVFPSVSGPVVSVTIDDSMGKGFLQLSGGIASAVGNLLVQHPFSDQLIFTTEYDSLGPLAKRLYDKLQAELKNLTLYAFNIDVKHAFPKLSMIQGHIFDLKENAELFFDSLLFYTSQLDEKKVEETLIYEISQHLPDDVHNEEITSNAIYLKYHDNIQKWWMSKDGTYLSKTGTLYKDAVEHTTGLPLTSVMNMMETLKNKHYDFNENAIRSIPLAQQPAQTIILTDSTSLTIAKLAKQLNYKNFIVLDLKYILNLVAKDDKALREELTNLKESITIIMDFSYLLQKKNCLRSQRKFQELVKSIQRHKTVIVADQESFYLVKKYFPNSNNVVKDTTNNLIDMSEESRTHVLENTQVMFLGNEVTLSQVIDNKSIAYVVGSVINKLMLGDLQTLTIGKSVHNSNYKKEMYLDRTLEDVEILDRNQKSSITICAHGTVSTVEYPTDGILSTRGRQDVVYGTSSQPSKEGVNRIRTRKYIDNNLKVLVGDAGIGKSTFLTHLSHEATKEQQDSWVLRINLIQQCKQFSEWQDSKKRIDVLESLKFLCQVALSKNHNNHEESGQVKIALEQCDGLFHLKDCSADDWTVFELKMFLHYYNTKRVLILLDGFDEICPMYENEVTAFINTLLSEDWQPRGHKMWITSRTVGNLDSSIGLTTGMVYKLTPLSGRDQDDYLIRYWDEKGLLKDLNDQQFRNIHDFVRSDDVYKLVKKVDSHDGPRKEIAFLSVYLSLIRYLASRLNKPKFRHFKLHEVVIESLKVLTESMSKMKIDNVISIPVHLNMIADYLFNKIRDTGKIPNTWDLNMNLFDIYEGFLKTKLKIRVQEKNKNDLFTPDNKSDFEEKYAKFMETHKKLGAYAVFGKTNTLQVIFMQQNEDQLKSIVEMVKDLKQDFLKTGVITNVVNNVPVFIHATFADYFAVEYICDLFKTDLDRPFIWNFILNVMFFSGNVGVLTLFDAKMKTNEELVALFKVDNEVVCDILLNQNVDGDIRSSLAEAVKHNLRAIGVFLCSAVADNLTDTRLKDFIKIVKDTNIIMTAIKMEFEVIIVEIVNLVKSTDSSKLVELFEKFKFIKNIENITTDELIQLLHKYLWNRMEIEYDWSFVREFVGLIQFI